MVKNDKRDIEAQKQAQEIKHYLKTGESDPLSSSWPGGPFLGGISASKDLRQALLAEVKRRAVGHTEPSVPEMDLHAFTRKKVEPMVNGLFPQAERLVILDKLEKSVIFLTAGTIDDVLTGRGWLCTAWDLANLYLLSIGAKPLGKDARPLVGLCEETNCYVSHEYFTQTDSYADFVVHEAAHVFHKCRRAELGLPETRSKKYLLDIDYRQRETFAYACEAYSRILELADSLKERISLTAELLDEYEPPDDQVDLEKYQSALLAAATARNGWKKILDVCVPPKKPAPPATSHSETTL
jgi:hypothetical protein